MSDNSANNKRIAKNTIFLYFRMLIKMLVSLYTSRVVLEYLGITDYGIYNVVGGIVTLFGFIVGPMTISVQRFLSFELGKKERDNTQINTIFSMAIFIHIILAIIVLFITETVGFSLLHTLQIPIERIQIAKWVLHISIITSCITILQIPYIGLIVAFEKMEAYAYISIVEVFLKLAIVFLLPIIPHDKLLVYAALIFFATIITQSLYAIYCKINIKSIKLTLMWDYITFKKLFNFALWSMFGELAWSVSGQGINILLGNFFAPAINAARGIAVQVLTVLKQFVYNFQTAINPQIIKSYAAEEINEAQKLTLNSIRLSFFLMFAISSPFLFHIDTVLTIWLKTVPEHTATFCKLAIVGILFDTLSTLLETMIKASGKIQKYQLTLSFCLILNLPISLLLLKLNFPPECVYIVYIIISIFIVFIRLFFLDKICGFSYQLYFKETILPILITIPGALSIPTILSVTIQSTSTLFTIVHFFICFITACLSIYYLGLKKGERKVIQHKLTIKKPRKFNN